MELREYFRVIIRAWWLIIPLTIMSLTLTLLFSYRSPSIYEATSRYVIGLNPVLGSSLDASVYSLDTLSGRQGIGVTYCEVMTGPSTITTAFTRLGVVDGIDFEKYETSCTVLPTSNVLLLVTRGTSPRLVQRLNETVGILGIQRVQELYNAFPLQQLDPVILEEDPVSPNHIQNAVLGAAMGIVVSLTLALLLDYLRTPANRVASSSIRDSRTNVYNMRYFQQRLSSEVERARTRNRPISVGQLRLIPNEDYELLPNAIQDDFLHQAAVLIESKLDEVDIVAYRGDTTFMILLPETPGYDASRRLEKIHENLRNHLFRSGDYGTSFTAMTGLVDGGGSNLTSNALIEEAEHSIEKADATPERSVHLSSLTPSAFVMDDIVEDTGIELENVLNNDSIVVERVQQAKPAEDGSRKRPSTGRLSGVFNRGGNRRADVEEGSDSDPSNPFVESEDDRNGGAFG
ncbi:MAG: diguanylate cyclase domain-containing protein [Phototrophicaceae bacterium]